MAVALRSSSTTGVTDSEAASLAVPVPTDVESKDLVYVAIEMWQSGTGNPVVTAPAGFSSIVDEMLDADQGFQKLKVWGKRLTAADSGNYNFTWAGAQWCQGQAIAISGGKETGDPVGANFDLATSALAVTNTPATSLNPVDFEPFLINFVANESNAAQAPPTHFTEVREANYLKTNYRIPGAEGAFSASGGVLSTSTSQISVLIAVEPEPDPVVGDTMSSLSDTARTNMLADRVLSEPQSISNVDLMRLVLADAGQTLVSKTEATAAVHLWRYLRTIRETV